jgi:PAS domain S-box-containing protein
MRAAQLIRAHLDELAAEWAAAARREIAPAAALPPLVLLDHVPDLLADLADWLEGEGREGAVDLWQRARAHAMDRLDHDFDLGQVLQEYRVLRRVLLRCLLAAEPPLERPEEIARVDEALDLALGESVRRFARARERLRLAEAERAQLALQAGDLGLWEWRPQTGEESWDARTQAIFGLPGGASVDHARFVSALHPDDRAREQTLLERLARSAQAGDSYRAEYRIARFSDGAERWIASRGRVVARDGLGRAERFIGTAADVTERKLAEQQVAELRERFVGIVSHDLRNPLNAITMAAALLLQSRQLSPPLARHAARIRANAERMARMIGDLLDLTRGRLGGGIPVSPEPARLGDVVAEVLGTLALARPDRRVVLEAEAGAPLDGEWDRDRVGQAVGNLVSNAFDHGDPGAPVTVTLRGEGDERVAVEVHNEGAPIAPELRAHLFDPFRRGRGGGDGGGLGLGLYIAREIARAHGGELTFTSSAAEGTTFRLVLPRHPRRAA